jgi:hypothetical protein
MDGERYGKCEMMGVIEWMFRPLRLMMAGEESLGYLKGVKGVELECSCRTDYMQNMDQLCVEVVSWRNRPSQGLLRKRLRVHGVVADGIDVACTRSVLILHQRRVDY